MNAKKATNPLMVIDGEKALSKILVEKFDLKTYVEIMDAVWQTNVATDLSFQKKFNRFYGVRLADSDRKVFYKVFEEQKIHNRKIYNLEDYKEIITKIREESKIVMPSFASKMLATLDKNMPILDSRVMDALGISRGQDIKWAIEAYDKVLKWYAGYMDTKFADENIKLWDSVFKDYRDYREISRIKKIDFLLWGTGGGKS